MNTLKDYESKYYYSGRCNTALKKICNLIDDYGLPTQLLVFKYWTGTTPIVSLEGKIPLTEISSYMHSAWVSRISVRWQSGASQIQIILENHNTWQYRQVTHHK